MATLSLACPFGTTIKPASITTTTQYVKTANLLGRTTDTLQWENLGTISTTSTSSYTVTTNVNATKFYNAFRLECTEQTSTSAKRIYDFKITSGWIKDDRP